MRNERLKGRRLEESSQKVAECLVFSLQFLASSCPARLRILDLEICLLLVTEFGFRNSSNCDGEKHCE